MRCSIPSTRWCCGPISSGGPGRTASRRRCWSLWSRRTKRRDGAARGAGNVARWLRPGRVAWIGERRCQATVEAFFDELGPERSAQLTHVSADGADWIHPVRAKAPQAKLCLDAFHVVKWANEKLDELRRRIAGELRAAG